MAVLIILNFEICCSLLLEGIVMKSKVAVIIVLAVVCGLFVALRPIEAQSAASSNQGKIVVLDVAKALTECQEYLAREKETDKKNSDARAEMGKLKQEVDSISEELKNVYEPGTPEYSTKLKTWFEKKASLEAMNEYVKETLTIETRSWTEALYGKLTAATAAVAREEGITMVINKDDTKLSSTNNIQELFTLIRTKEVIYNSPTLDITGLVIEKMDADFTK